MKTEDPERYSGGEKTWQIYQDNLKQEKHGFLMGDWMAFKM